MLGEAGLYEAGRRGEAPPYVDDEPVPQLGCMCVPEDVAGVVVAVGAQWLADDWGIGGMDSSAAEGTAVLAGTAVAAGSADVRRPVDGSKGRSSQGDEETGPVADSGGDVLATEEASADEVEGVSGVEVGAGGADGGAAVAASDEETFAGFVAGVVVPKGLAGVAIQGGGGAGEVDGMSAPASGSDLFQPAGELGVLCEADCVAVGFGELA